MNTADGKARHGRRQTEEDACLVILITAPTREKAETLGEGLVEKGLAACVNVIPSVTSIYTWEGELCREQESLMLVKSTSSLFSRVTEYVRQNHEYEVPEVIALPIVNGLKEYIDWVRESCSKPRTD